MEYRTWQLRFLKYLDSQPSGAFINLCGGPWGKTFLAKMNQDANVSYYHCLSQLPSIQRDLQSGKKIVFVSHEKDVEGFTNLSKKVFHIETEMNTDVYEELVK